MAYRIFWQIPNELLYLELEGDLVLDDFNQINQIVTRLLDSAASDKQVALLVDITRPGTTPRSVAQLRDSQTYLLRHDLRYVLVAGTDKVMRLMMMLTFNLCRPSLLFYNDIDKALSFLSRESKQAR